MWGALWPRAGCAVWLAAALCLVAAQFDWQRDDEFDRVARKMRRVNGGTCELMSLNDLFLDNNTVSHLPNSEKIVGYPIFPNRTHLVYLHNLVLSRGHFFSFAIQSRLRKETSSGSKKSELDPGMMYYYLSVAADIASSPYINSSAVYFAPNSSYSPSFRSNFNHTFPLFAPRAFRADDYNYPFHLERISTMNTIEISDLGAIEQGRSSVNYTDDMYRINEWYKKWLPDRRKSQKDKTTYTIKIRYADNHNETLLINGPRAADEKPGPVAWFRPYFDCGRSNKWVMGATTPIVDRYHRHTKFLHIEYPTYVAASVIELDFERIDINQCPISEGNSRPNAFGGTARCTPDTTECEPIDGFGFRRGGYECRCKPGYRLPKSVRRPYLGEMVERATDHHRQHYFKCDRVGLLQEQITNRGGPMDQYRRAQYMGRAFYQPPQQMDNSSRRQPDSSNVEDLRNFILSVNAGNCKQFDKRDLVLRDDALYGAEKQFRGHAQMALRLANFVSSFLQVSDPTEVFSDSRVPDEALSEDQMMGEVLSIVMGDYHVQGAGIYWDRNKFGNKTLFAPYAYRRTSDTARNFFIDDLARINSTEDVYLNNDIFRKVKARWSTNYESLDKIWLKMLFRSEPRGKNIFLRKYTRYPDYYRAANLEHGYWSSPYFDCGGIHPGWLVTYAAPFFGWDDLKHNLEFKGMVSVSMKFERLNVNQCDQDYWVPNAFKNTHKCDKQSTYCVPIQGRSLQGGSYRCECRQGYEFPFNQYLLNYYDGDRMENEFRLLVNNQSTIFDYLTCRLAHGCCLHGSWLLVLTSIGMLFVLRVPRML